MDYDTLYSEVSPNTDISAQHVVVQRSSPRGHSLTNQLYTMGRMSVHNAG